MDQGLRQLFIPRQSDDSAASGNSMWQGQAVTGLEETVISQLAFICDPHGLVSVVFISGYTMLISWGNGAEWKNPENGHNSEPWPPWG